MVLTVMIRNHKDQSSRREGETSAVYGGVARGMHTTYLTGALKANVISPYSVPHGLKIGTAIDSARRIFTVRIPDSHR